MTRARAIRLAFTAGLAALVLVNVISLATGSDARRIERSPDSAYAAARLSPYKSVRFTFSVYDYIRNHLAGKKLTIPRALHGHTWFLQRIGRVELDVLDATPIDHKRFRKLRQAPDHIAWIRTEGTPLDLYFVYGKHNADHYVIAQNPEGSDLIVLPQETYEALAVPP